MNCYLQQHFITQKCTTYKMHLKQVTLTNSIEIKVD